MQLECNLVECYRKPAEYKYTLFCKDHDIFTMGESEREVIRNLQTIIKDIIEEEGEEGVEKHKCNNNDLVFSNDTIIIKSLTVIVV